MQATMERAVHHWNMVAPVVTTPTTPEGYETLLTNLKDTIELVKNRPNSPLSGLIKAMSAAVQEYEGELLNEQQGGGLLSLRYLIKLHNVKQADLKEIGSQGVVSEILNGKRSLTLRHVRELSKKFKVSPNVFIDAH